MTLFLATLRIPSALTRHPLPVMHYGHMNAFRQVRTAAARACKLPPVASPAHTPPQFVGQGRSHGTYLIVGVNSDESILKCKGPPVQNNQERIEAVRACKWVDEVVENVP